MGFDPCLGIFDELLGFYQRPSILDDYGDFINVQASLMIIIGILSTSKHPSWLMWFDPCPSILDDNHWDFNQCLSILDDDYWDWIHVHPFSDSVRAGRVRASRVRAGNSDWAGDRGWWQGLVTGAGDGGWWWGLVTGAGDRCWWRELVMGAGPGAGARIRGARHLGLSFASKSLSISRKLAVKLS